MSVGSLKPWILILGACASACADRGPADSSNEALQEVFHLSEEGPTLYLDRICNPVSTNPAPSPDDRFEYMLMDAHGAPVPGVVRKEVIDRMAGDVSEYTEILEIPGAEASPGERRRLRAGILPLSGPGMQIAYLGGGKEPQALKPGEKTTYPVQYTASGDFGVRSATSEISLQFLGCKEVAPGRGIVSGEPVRLYRVVVPMLLPPPSTAPLSATEFEWAISERKGWRMIERSPSASTIVVKIN